MGKKDAQKYEKILGEIKKLSLPEREEYFRKLSNAERDGYIAWIRQKFLNQEKARITEGRISSIKEMLKFDIEHDDRYGEPESDKHIDALIKEGIVTKEGGEKWRARVRENRKHQHLISSLKLEIKEGAKILKGLDPTEAAKAILNKNKIAGIEKAKATRARNKQKKIEENAALERFLMKTNEELQAELEEQKRREKLVRDPYIDELFGAHEQTRWS